MHKTLLDQQLDRVFREREQFPIPTGKSLKMFLLALQLPDENIDSFYTVATIIIFPPEEKTAAEKSAMTRLRKAYKVASDILAKISIDYQNTNDMLVFVRNYIELAEQKSNHDTAFKQIKAVMEEDMMPIIFEYFEENGINHINIGNRTAYIRTQYWPVLREGIDKEDAVEALKNSTVDLGYLVSENYNTMSLRSAFKELEFESGDDLPDDLKKFFDISPKHSVSVRKA